MFCPGLARVASSSCFCVNKKLPKSLSHINYVFLSPVFELSTSVFEVG